MTADVDVVIEDPRWAEVGLQDLAKKSVTVTLEHLGVSGDMGVAVLACDDARIAGLNTEFRGKPAATNVLSWPSEDRAPASPGAMPAPPEPGTEDLGDIAISYDTVLREAGDQRKTTEAHAVHLLVHATLHLLGYDHINDKDAEIMEKTEVNILASMGFANPY